MNRCYLGLGSNLHCPERQIRMSIKKIAKLPGTSVWRCSSLFRSKPWGFTKQPDFCNAVIAINTRLQPLLLLKQCQDIERKMGRVRNKKWGPRIIDIDLLIYNDRSHNSPALTLPHPYMHQRDFVTIPLESILHPTY